MKITVSYCRLLELCNGPKLLGLKDEIKVTNLKASIDVLQW